MTEALVEAGEMPPEGRVAAMRQLLGSMAGNDMSDIEELGRFIDLYDAHEVPASDRLAFFESLDIPEQGVMFGESTFDTIVEEYDALGGVERDLVHSVGKAYVAVATVLELFRSQKNEPEESPEWEILCEREEFYTFAEEMDYSRNVATIAWNALAERFLRKVQPTRYRYDLFHDPEEYADFPADLFARRPALSNESILGRNAYMNQVTDLRLHVLEDMLARIEAGSSRPSAIRAMLGYGVGPISYQFLTDFSRSRRQEAEADSTPQ